MKYKLSLEDEKQHFLNLQFSVEVSDRDSIELQLPAWRPGRYELADFAKNIQKFNVKDNKGNDLKFNKITKDRWRVETANVDAIIVNYNYYAVDFNAGSTYVSEDILYVNPVNCFIYIEELQDKPCEIEIPIKSGQQVAGVSLKGNVFFAKDYHQLVDSPFIVSSKLQKQSYTINTIKFNIWFYGECKPQWDKLLNDFKKFTQYQIDKFGDIPVKEYHFLNIIHPYKAYHGVEHINSTVITLGPTYDVFDELYTELLGISSHELYHVWNIKTIRPKEMLPYNYAKENYSRLGYVAEGVTTYMGDLMLYESGVFSKDEYATEFNKYLKRHFNNDGRLNLSLAESSFDTWLDGYSLGIPDRKSSIYIEGALVAFITDIQIRRKSNGEFSLHDVMKTMYLKYGKEGIGYTEEDYKLTVEEYLGTNWDSFYEKYISETSSLEVDIKQMIKYFGYELKKVESEKLSQRYGLIYQELSDGVKIVHVKLDSEAYKAGLTRGDVITTVNNHSINRDFDKWLSYYEGEVKQLTVLYNGMSRKTVIGKTFNIDQFYSFYLA